MKIAVLGATGETGHHLVNQALEQGHTVTAIVRNPARLDVHHDNLKVVAADIFSADSLTTHFEGQDVIMSCLGFSAFIFPTVTGYTLSMKSVVSAMREAQVTKIITVTSWYTEPNSDVQASHLLRFVLLPMIRNILSDMHEMEKFLQETEDIDWTVVRPPNLKNLPVSDQEFLTHEGYFVPICSGTDIYRRAGIASVKRGDLARFMLSLLNSNPWVRKGVAIASK